MKTGVGQGKSSIRWGRWAVLLGWTSLVALVAADSIPIQPRGRWPEAPVFPGNGYAKHIATDGDMAYVATSESLLVLSISDPAQMKVLGQVAGVRAPMAPLPGNQHLVTAAHAPTLRRFDLSDPARPLLLGGGYTETIQALQAISNSVYLATDRLEILDAGGPAPWTVLGRDASLRLQALATDGRYLFGWSGGGWLHALDVSRPAAPRTVGQVPVPIGLSVDSMILSGDRLFVGYPTASVEVWDVSDPRIPKRAGPSLDWGQSNGDVGMAVRDSQLCVVGNRAGLRVADVSTQNALTVLGSLGADALGSQGAADVAWPGRYAFLAAGIDGLRAVDLAEPASPRIVGSLGPIDFRAVCVSGSYAWVAGTGQGLLGFDVSDPDHPRRHVQVPVEGSANHVTQAGDFVFVTSDHARFPPTGWLTIVDVADPTRPRLRSRVGITGVLAPVSVAVRGTLAYVIDFGTGLTVVDASNPDAPVVGRTLPMGQWPAYSGNVTLGESRAYVALDANGLRILDLSRAAEPAPLGTFPGRTLRVVEAGPYAWVVGDDFRVLDLRDPSVPRLVGSYPAASPVAVARDGNRAWVAGESLEVLDLADPTRPVRLGGFPGIKARGIAIQGPRLFAACGTNGLRILDAVEAPRLRITRAGTIAEVSWDTTTPPLVLQRSPRLVPPHWQDVVGSDATRTHLVTPDASTESYYRLRLEARQPD